MLVLLDEMVGLHMIVGSCDSLSLSLNSDKDNDNCLECASLMDDDRLWSCLFDGLAVGASTEEGGGRSYHGRPAGGDVTFNVYC